jgi:valine--pyruvate aminotransferase
MRPDPPPPAAAGRAAPSATDGTAPRRRRVAWATGGPGPAFTAIGRKLSGRTGIHELMTDLGRALAVDRSMRMLGGGNPARIPAMEAVWRRRWREMLDEGDEVERLLGCYDEPRGRPAFIEALVGCLNERFGWGLGPENVAVTNGSQNAFFFLFNMLAGRGGPRRRILLPLAPEYIGYADQGMAPDLFVSARPQIEERGGRIFKYRVDFDALPLDDDVAAICVSRPTNPTGNVLTDDEIRRLRGLAAARGIPLIVDNAYGAPFPDIIFSSVEPEWDEHTVLSFSLSKVGLPGTRTGMVIAREEIASALSAVNAVASLANGNLGQALVAPLLRSGELMRLSREVIRPFYERKSRMALAWVDEFFGDRIPCRVHASEGAIFLWLWFPGLPITSAALYERLKARKVLVVSGHYFFYGLPGPWAHRDECIRITYSQADEAVRDGLRVIAEEVSRAFGVSRAVGTGA